MSFNCIFQCFYVGCGIDKYALSVFPEYVILYLKRYSILNAKSFYVLILCFDRHSINFLLREVWSYFVHILFLDFIIRIESSDLHTKCGWTWITGTRKQLYFLECYFFLKNEMSSTRNTLYEIGVQRVRCGRFLEWPFFFI